MRAEKRTHAFQQLGHTDGPLARSGGSGGRQTPSPAPPGYSPFAASSSAWRSSMRRILPVSVFGSSSTNSILRGYA